MRVLISAYACEPNAGSEPGVGWHWVRQAVLNGHDVHVITRANNRESIESAMREDPLSGVTFHYLDLPRPVRLLKKRTGTVGLLAYYYAWQLALAFKAYLMHRRRRFDLVHHVTFANDWLPAGVSLVPGVPFVWGPVGGSSHVAPRHIVAGWPREDRNYERLRKLVQRTFLTFDPLLRWTRHRAAIVLPYTEEAKFGLPRSLRAKSRVVTHIGVEEVSGMPRKPEGEPLEIVTGGRLVHWKGFDLLLEGMSEHLRRHPGTAHLTVTGSGPWAERLALVAKDRGISESVDFVGRLPGQSDVLAIVAKADLYALPTWRDGPPVAILEAMSVATPIMCLDLGATAELVPREAGVLIPVSDRGSVIRAIGDAITWCQSHRRELAEMGLAAASQARTVHLWTSIGSSIDAIYRDIADGK